MEIIRKQALVGINETLETIRKIHKAHSELEQRVTLITFDSTHKKLFYDNVAADDARNLSMRDYRPCGWYAALRCHRYGHRENQRAGC